MKNVLVLTTTFPRWQNDTTPRFVYDLTERLAAKYSMTVLAPHYKGALKKEVLGKMLVRRFAYFKPESLQKLCYDGGIIPNMQKSFLAKIQMPFLIISEFFSAYKIIKKEKTSMIHAHWILPQGLVGIFLKKIFKIPIIVTIHGSDIFALNSFLFRKMQHYVVKNSDFITLSSDAVRNELLKRFPNFASKFKVLSMGINIDVFKKNKTKKPRKFAKNKILLFVGRLSDQKGLQYLIDAMPEIVKHNPDAKLLIIGEGPYGDTLRKIVLDNKLNGYVEFLGPMIPTEVAYYYNICDIFILPSLSTKTGTEALGLSLIEAMSCGCAVIGTNIGGIPFVVKNNKNGVLVREKNPKDLSNAATDLLKDRKKALKLGKNATKSVRNKYSWNIISKEFSKIYNELIK